MHPRLQVMSWTMVLHRPHATLQVDVDGCCNLTLIGFTYFTHCNIRTDTPVWLRIWTFVAVGTCPQSQPPTLLKELTKVSLNMCYVHALRDTAWWYRSSTMYIVSALWPGDYYPGYSSIGGPHPFERTQSNSAPAQPLASGAAATGFGATPSRLCKHFVHLHVYYSDRL